MRGLSGIAALPSGAFVVDNKLELAGDVAGTLAAHVRGPARVRSWLQAVLVADDLGEAQRLCRDLSPGQSVVTPDGHWLGKVAPAPVGVGHGGGHDCAAKPARGPAV
ncbi:MAG: hypothetical protein CM15mP125_2090 [Gammaproteobacteria bacterium]|nr:MAG: hypothetical protein CM15mP125_2090 [Gammaproteobacteria bacterium]